VLRADLQERRGVLAAAEVGHRVRAAEREIVLPREVVPGGLDAERHIAPVRRP
jgi:hypothetical protein